MATKRIRKAAVIGGGVMGQGIAALLASARIPVILYDIVPKDARDSDDPVARNAYAAGAVQKIKKSRPSLIYTKRDADLYITPANVEDHMDLLADCDFIVEAVPEVLKIKQITFDNVEDHAREDAIIASNTSGLSIKNMIDGRSESFKKRFVVTHFFNPVRYMKLLEIVPGEQTDPEVMETMAEFGSRVLGKGIVYAKDTTNFIANRIGVHGMMSIMNSMSAHGMSPTDVDVIFGKAMGRPRSAVFGTADVVGLDTFVHVSQNCYDTLVDDEEREVFQIPDFVHAMVEKGWTGRKAGAGFFKKVGKEIHALNLETMEYEPRVKKRFDSIGAARGAKGPAGSIKAVVVDGTDDAAAFAREVTLKSLAYSARRLGEIADDIVNIDRGMRWGFNWELGPFQTWDAIGVKWGRDAMKEAGIEVAGWIDEMIEAGHTSFYQWDGTTELYYDPSSKAYKAIERPENEQTVDLLRRANKDLASNDGATLFDGGDDVLVLEFHSKANTVDLDVIDMLEKAVETMEGGHWKGLVLANDSDNFSMGANVGLVVGAANSGAFDQIEELVKRFQDVNQAMRYSSKPVVAAPTGMTLGGGAEMTMGANATVAAGELYIGLVEFGVGLIPGGGGNLQLMRNVFGMHAGSPDFDALPFLQKIFMTIGMAKVATSAEEAKESGFLTHDSIVSLGRQHLLYKAKQLVLGMSASGFTPPRPAQFRLPGRDGYATIDMLLYSMVENNQISAHDRLIGQKLAHVITGGHTGKRVLVGEQDLLDLEREAFLSLCGEEKTKERMIHMAMKNKPLRN
jgi:3-hydroxyacyl-CoA dehydrogenase